jgi:hypothetical protein
LEFWMEVSKSSFWRANQWLTQDWTFRFFMGFLFTIFSLQAYSRNINISFDELCAYT